MNVIKKINNNVAICVDGNNNELVAFGIGIGFPKMPYELNDLTCVTRTFYNLESFQLSLLSEISEELINVSVEIVDKAKDYLGEEFHNSLILTLADHLDFAIKNAENQELAQRPLFYDIPHLYEKEFYFSRWARTLVNNRMSVILPEEEEINITLHIINALSSVSSRGNNNTRNLISAVTTIIETEMKTIIDQQSLNYARFTTHLQYLFKKRETPKMVNHNDSIFEQLLIDYPNTYQCALKVVECLQENLDTQFNNDDILYLILHINRLYNRNRL